MDRDALLPAALALLGVVALLGAVTLYPHAGQSGGYHSVERIEASEVPDDAERSVPDARRDYWMRSMPALLASH